MKTSPSISQPLYLSSQFRIRLATYCPLLSFQEFQLCRCVSVLRSTAHTKTLLPSPQYCAVEQFIQEFN